MSRSTPPLFPHHGGYAPMWRGSAPHLTPAEQQLIYWWLDKSPGTTHEVYYDVAMDGIPGNATPPLRLPFGTTGKFARMWQRLTSKRADAIIRTGNHYQIIEARTTAKAQTLGELHQYDTLSRAEWPDLAWLPPFLICQAIDYATLDGLKRAGFQYAIAPETLILSKARGRATLTKSE